MYSESNNSNNTPGSSGGYRERQVAANTKPTDLGCESAIKLLPTTTAIAMYYYSTRRLILILLSHGR